MVDVLQHQWNRQNPVMLPASRKGSCMAYHAQHGVAVLFGGGGFNDTWHWDGQVWVEQRPSIAPPPRTNACMTYDAARQCIVLFGGQTYGGRAGTQLNDTWIWNGSSWQQHIAQLAPPARLGA